MRKNGSWEDEKINMKIGIITFHFADNYGAVLQTLALRQKISELFIPASVYIIDYRPQNIVKTFSLFHSALVTGSLPMRFCKLLFAVLKFPFFLKRKYEFNLIRKKYFDYIGVHDVGILDSVICGSDQIWNPKITGGLDSNYFGIVNGIKMKTISYAASDGGNLKDEPPGVIDNLLQNISCISVREKSLAVRLAEFAKGKDVVVSIDPVFLPGSAYWRKIAKEPKYKNYILIYRLETNNQIYEDAYQLAKNTGKEVIEITTEFINVLKNKHKTLTMTGVDQFITLFMYADFILTNSFHGTAFSIIFNKQFCSYHIKNGNERISDLLSDLNISDRHVNSASGIFERRINYDPINNLLEQKRKEAEFYLKGCFKGC
jgi:hypothetical protein